MNMFKLLPILVVLALAALLEAGCGGGDTATLSKAEFVKQAEAICQKSNEKRSADYGKYVETHAGPSTEQIVTSFVLPSIEEAAAELSALGAPSGDERKIESITAGIEEAVKKAEKDPESFEVPLRGPANLARSYGLEVCASIL